MNDRKLVFGLIATAAWVVAGLCMFRRYGFPADLSTWGNFLAGFTSPLAFLWLVLGYLQQGDELKQSTEALRLQAAELQNSVEQQTSLVTVAQEQLAHERMVRRDAARPVFHVQSGGLTVNAGQTELGLTVYNLGNTATGIVISFEPPLGRQDTLAIEAIGRDQCKTVWLRIAGSAAAAKKTKGKIRYIDGDGQPGLAEFDMELGADLTPTFGPVIRVS